MREIRLLDIQAAAQSVYDLVIRTPLIRLDLPVAFAGIEVFLKLELLQPIGSFKIRGAHNAVRQLPAAEARAGVWTVSAGNAAQGVALAARRAGVPCSVMVMDTAPATKIEAIRRLGAAIVPASYDECWRTVEAHGSSRMAGCFVHPFDDDRFIAGNGTAGLEILEDLPGVDAIVAAVGGGGLLAGVASAVRALRPEVRIFAAEPETAAPLDASFRQGRAARFEGWRASFVDGAGGRSVLPTMWPLLQRLVEASIVVSLRDIASAMKLVAERCHVIAEGAAACAVAGALALARRPADPRPGTRDSGSRPVRIVAIVSGGNIDLRTFASLVGACETA
jgi:threonine dehydratase